MKKIALLATFFLLVTAGMGWAFNYNSIYLDIGENNNGDGDTLTGVFTRMKFEDITETIFDGLVPDTIGDSETFTDHGVALVTKLGVTDTVVLSYSDSENMVVTDSAIGNPIFGDWEATLAWNSLTGTITKTDTDEWSVSYDAGSMVSFYLDINPDAQYDGNNALDPDGTFGYNNGLVKLNAQVDWGQGFADGFASGNVARSLELYYTVTSITADFMYLADGTDLNTLVGSPGVIAFATEGTDTDRTNFTTVFDANGNPVNNVLNAEGEGTFGVAVVPEPSTMLLLGLGLLGVSAVGRRKFRS